MWWVFFVLVAWVIYKRNCMYMTDSRAVVHSLAALLVFKKCLSIYLDAQLLEHAVEVGVRPKKDVKARLDPVPVLFFWWVGGVRWGWGGGVSETQAWQHHFQQNPTSRQSTSRLSYTYIHIHTTAPHQKNTIKNVPCPSRPRPSRPARPAPPGRWACSLLQLFL